MEANAKYYQCAHCNRTFTRVYNLKRHLENVHNRYLETDDSMDTSSTDSDSGDSSGADESPESGPASSASSASESESADSDSSNDSTISEMGENEWREYIQQLECLMRETFNETMREMAPDNYVGELTTEEHELVMNNAKKAFRKKLARHVNIVFGMQEDGKYQYLFDKLSKYRENDIDFPTAISMAVKASAAIIDKDFENAINPHVVEGTKVSLHELSRPVNSKILQIPG